jgi:hypothetical protein
MTLTTSSSPNGLWVKATFYGLVVGVEDIEQ